MNKCYICGQYDVKMVSKIALSDKIETVWYKCLRPGCNNVWKEDRTINTEVDNGRTQ